MLRKYKTWALKYFTELTAKKAYTGASFQSSGRPTASNFQPTTLLKKTPVLVKFLEAPPGDCLCAKILIPLRKKAIDKG